MERRRSLTTGRLVAGLLAGFLSALVFHQTAVAFLHVLGWTDSAFYDSTAGASGVPGVWMAALLGAAAGMPLVMLERVLPRGPAYLIAAVGYGAVTLTLVSMVAAAVAVGPSGDPWSATTLAAALLANGAWGAGAALFLALLGGRA